MKRAAAKAAPKPTAPVLATAKPGDALLIVTPHTRYMDVVVEADAAFVKARVAGKLRRSDGTGIVSPELKAVPARKVDGQAIAAEAVEGRHRRGGRREGREADGVEGVRPGDDPQANV